MKTFTKEQKNSITAEAKRLFEACAEGKTTLEIMSEIYVNNLEGKTAEEGNLAAQSIIDYVKEFDAEFTAAKENPDKYIADFISKINENKTLEERCTYWLKFHEALKIINQRENDTADKLKEAEKLEVSPDEVSEEYALALENNVSELIKTSHILLHNLPDLCNSLETIADGDSSAQLLIDIGNKNTDLRAISSMIVYTRFLNGELNTLPDDLNLNQLVTIVCAEYEQIKIANEVSIGEKVAELAADTLAILGLVVMVKLAKTALTLAGGYIVTTFSWFLAIPAIIMLLAATFHIMQKTFAVWNEDCQKIVKFVSGTVKSVVNGARSIYDYSTHQLFPKAIKKAKEIYTAIKRKIASA